MQRQPPKRKQLRKQDFSSNCYFTGGCRLGTAPHFAPENLRHSHREPLSSNRFWEAKDEALSGWSANLTLQDYGRVVRNSGSAPRDRSRTGRQREQEDRSKPR